MVQAVIKSSISESDLIKYISMFSDGTRKKLKKALIGVWFSFKRLLEVFCTYMESNKIFLRKGLDILQIIKKTRFSYVV